MWACGTIRVKSEPTAEVAPERPIVRCSWAPRQVLGTSSNLSHCIVGYPRHCRWNQLKSVTLWVTPCTADANQLKSVTQTRGPLHCRTSPHPVGYFWQHVDTFTFHDDLWLADCSSVALRQSEDQHLGPCLRTDFQVGCCICLTWLYFMSF